MKIRHIALPFCALAFAAQPALAQQFKPGLWETNNKMAGGAGGKLQEAMAMVQQQMATMDPEQRKRIEGMMSRQGVVLSNDGVVVAKMCITPEMAARQQLPIQQHGNCTYQHAPVVGNTMKFSFSCTNPQANGEGSATFSGPAAYTSTMRVTTNATGASETVNLESAGRWLGAECGAVKPIMLPEAK